MKSTLLNLAIAASIINPVTTIEGRSVDVEAVVRDCVVLDDQGCLVTSPPELVLRTAGADLSCAVRRLASAIRIVFVRDRSFSLSGERDRTIRRAFDLMLKGLARLSDDHLVAVLEFDEDQEWKTSGFVTPTTALASLRWTATDGGTDLWAGMNAALDLVAATPSELPTMMIVATDGSDLGPRDRDRFEAVKARVASMRLPVYFLGFPVKRLENGRIVDPDGDGERRCWNGDWKMRSGSDQRMAQVAAVAGGAAFFPKKSERLAKLVRFLLAEVLGRFRVEAEGTIGDVSFEIVARRGYEVRCDAE